MRQKVRTGVDVLLDGSSYHLSSPKVGLITNPTGVTGVLTSTLDALHSHRGVELVSIFGPEHGVRGDRQDAILIDSTVDEATGVSVYSLFGEVMKPTTEMLDGVEALVFDIQDIGARFYTYASTLTYCMEAASEQGVPIAILDRPNPINGLSVEGNILEPGFESFVGLHQVPIRHGLTIGELATMINEGIGAELSVVEMEGWERELWFDETGLPWVQPSPNIPTPETTIVYPGTCLFEGVNISEGRGTTRPFEFIGAPWINGRKWAGSLNRLGLDGVAFRACHFTPTFSKYRGEGCGGVQVHVTDRESYRPVETALYMLSTAMELWPGDFKWLPPSHGKRLHFDLLAGTDKTRLDLSHGGSVEDVVEGWKDELDEFKAMRGNHLLYPIGGV